MYTVTQYPQGTFCWLDGQTTDQEQADAFYKAVLGWDVQRVPIGDYGEYSLYQVQGRDVAGLATLPPDSEQPPSWTVHIAVDDVAAMTERARELGATVLAEPFEVMENGRMSLIADPTGAVVSLWQAKNHIGAGIVNTTGAMCWNELMTPDVEAAKTFFADLFGWTYQAMDDEEGYWFILNHNGRMNGGIMALPEGVPAPMWNNYFTVEDLDATIEAIKANGGAVYGEVIPSAAGKSITASDPAGAYFSPIEAHTVDPWLEHDAATTA